MENSAFHTVVIIVAAGRGERAGLENGPKQYQPLGDSTVLANAMAPFLNHEAVDAVRVVIHCDDEGEYSNALPEAIANHTKLQPPVFGGATRQASVACGLESFATHKPARVLVHDAARPFVSDAVISNVLNGLEHSKNSLAVLPCVALVDTVKQADGPIITHTLDRSTLYAAQTPQGFDFDILLTLHRDAKAHNVEVTDDVALAEQAGITVYRCEGEARNIKLTTREDMMNTQSAPPSLLPDVRVGHGYDTHQLVSDKELWLCGIRLEHSHGLSGHSDADVGLHALTDALLSTIADGDIGSHFPPSDPQWKGARSDQFLAHAVQLVKKAGGTITHMDVTLLCETPKIGPHRDRMRAKMAEITGIDQQRISVKATTNEKIGFIGRQEGMVALATATAVFGVLA